LTDFCGRNCVNSLLSRKETNELRSRRPQWIQTSALSSTSLPQYLQNITLPAFTGSFVL
jgi:hypothetical protein